MYAFRQSACRRVGLTILALFAVALRSAAPAEQPARPIELFNGKDLSGWVNVNGAADTWQVRDGLLICSGVPKGILRSEQMYENYVLELEWKHVKAGGNS